MNIFIHYLDKELLDLNLLTKPDRATIDDATMAIKIAILLTNRDEHVLVPASSYFESELGMRVLERFRDIADLGILHFVSTSQTLKGFIEKKYEEHPLVYQAPRFHGLQNELIRVPAFWRKRKNSATEDIREAWKNRIDSNAWEDLYKITKYRKPSVFETALAKIPNRIFDKAFVADYVIPELSIQEHQQNIAKELISTEITKAYINSFLQEYNAVCFKRFILVNNFDHLLPEGYKHVDYADVCYRLKLYEQNCGGKNLYTIIWAANHDELLKLRSERVLNVLFDRGRNRDIFIIEGKKEKKLKTFIVHGHDDNAKLQLKNYIQNTLRLGEPIVLSEKASGGRTIIEKFEQYAEDCNLVFILLTPDDQYVEDQSGENGHRARQNVIFEMGYFLGKLGRESGRIILLYKGNLDLPSDILGLVYINIDNGIDAAGEQIRKEIDYFKDEKNWLV